MNPKEFSWGESQQVTVKNPTAEPFTWQVHGKEYTLDAGKAAVMPGYLAWVYVYNQAAKMAQAEKKWDQWNDEPIRQAYYEKFVSAVQPVIQEIQEEKSLMETVDTDGDEEETTPPAGTGGETYTPSASKSSDSSKTASKTASTAKAA